MFNQAQMPLAICLVILQCNVARKGHACDSHFLLRAILDYPHKNGCDFEGTCELVAREHQVTFELYHISKQLEYVHSKANNIVLNLKWLYCLDPFSSLVL